MEIIHQKKHFNEYSKQDRGKEISVLQNIRYEEDLLYITDVDECWHIYKNIF
jgi:hypothetical protein